MSETPRPRPEWVQRWHLRAWREYRDLTQEQLAAIIGTGKSTISKLERYQLYGPGEGRQKTNDDWLNHYCRALDITTRQLSEPPESQRSIDEILKNSSPADQTRFRALAEAFVKSDK
jgi:transcriptional regulator with XRE-family HTH domain